MQRPEVVRALVTIGEPKEPKRYPEGTQMRMLSSSAHWEYWKHYTGPWTVDTLISPKSVGVRIFQMSGNCKMTTLAAWRDLELWAETPCGCGNPARHKVEFEQFLAL